MKRKTIERPVYLLLGKTVDIQNIMFRFYRGIFILVLFYIVPIYSTDECADRTNCTVKDGKHTVGSKSTGPPRMKFKTTSKTVTLKTTIGLDCRLCQSNPSSTIEWLFNGKPLIFKGERIYNTSTLCKQTLYLSPVLSEDEGNYTCVARNEFGEANSTTEVKIFGSGCSNECVLTDGGRHKVGTRLGPPKMKGERYTQNSVTNDMVQISCELCESNPPSKLTWFFNGIQLDLNKNKIHVISGGCEESLHFRVLKNKAGNYTCMAKNDWGQVYSTTQLKVWDAKMKRPMITVKLEAQPGSIYGNAVKIGSRLNITCSILSPNCAELIWSWKENDQLITQNETQYRQENGTNACIRKLMIDKVMAASTGIYQCSAMGWNKVYLAAPSQNEISISAVPCFKGFYCPPKVHGAKRCPNGTFSMQQNATNLKQCEPCPTNARNKILSALNAKNPEAASIFEINCPYYTETSDKHSGLSHGEIVAIAVSLTALVIVVILALLYAMRNCWDYKRLVHRPPKDIQIEIPDVPQSADVFVCYSSKNREWVHGTLFSNLRAQHFETFIDFIDFEIGLPIHQNIVNGVYGSRKTIFVLSKDSLRSYYARTELSQALAAGRQTGHQVIVILFEKCKVPEEISNIVYLDWTDEEKRDNFWEKLYDAVRKPLESEVAV